MGQSSLLDDFQRCNIVATLLGIVKTLFENCCPKIAVANRLAKHPLNQTNHRSDHRTGFALL